MAGGVHDRWDKAGVTLSIFFTRISPNGPHFHPQLSADKPQLLLGQLAVLMEKSSANPELLNSISGTHTVLLKNRVERNIAIRLGYL
jgi:hypothetical protein